MVQKLRKVGLSRATSSLSTDEIAQMKGMLSRGDRQVDIAQWFGVNQSFVNRLRLGRLDKHRHTQAAPEKFLPPAGPYALVSQGVADQAQADRLMIEELAQLLTKFRGRLDKYSNSVQGDHTQSNTVSTRDNCNFQPHPSGTGL
jgi:hypothetical protein